MCSLLSDRQRCGGTRSSAASTTAAVWVQHRAGSCDGANTLCCCAEPSRWCFYKVDSSSDVQEPEVAPQADQQKKPKAPDRQFEKLKECAQPCPPPATSSLTLCFDCCSLQSKGVDQKCPAAPEDSQLGCSRKGRQQGHQSDSPETAWDRQFEKLKECALPLPTN